MTLEQRELLATQAVESRRVAAIYWASGRAERGDEAASTADAIDAALKRIERLEVALGAVVNNLDYLRNQWGDEGITRTVRDKVDAALEGRD